MKSDIIHNLFYQKSNEYTSYFNQFGEHNTSNIHLMDPIMQDIFLLRLLLIKLRLYLGEIEGHEGKSLQLLIS